MVVEVMKMLLNHCLIMHGHARIYNTSCVEVESVGIYVHISAIIFEEIFGNYCWFLYTPTLTRIISEETIYGVV